MTRKTALSFALVIPNAPWWNLGIVTKQIMKTHGYDVELSQSKSEDLQIKRVADGDADIGVNTEYMALWSFNGTGHYKGQPKPNLRAIAYIAEPCWFGFAVTRETRITSFEQMLKMRFPLRLYTYRGDEITGSTAFVIREVLRGYDITLEQIEEWGGHIWTDLNGGKEAVRDGNFDAFFKHAYPAYGPVGMMWQQASIRSNLRFLPVRDDILADLTARHGLSRGLLPNTLMRGADTDVPTVHIKGHIIYVTDKFDEKLAYLMAKAYCEQSDVFMSRYVRFGYNPLTACNDVTIPLHPGAERFYREAGFLNSPLRRSLGH
jgi:TRAP transporter TAXI family solute receptor